MASLCSDPMSNVLYEEIKRDYALTVCQSNNSITIKLDWDEDFLGSFLLNNTLDTLQQQLKEKNIKIENILNSNHERKLTFIGNSTKEKICVKNTILSMFEGY